MSRIQPMSERDWEAESDLRALSRASEIRNDPARMARAQKRAGEMVNEARDNLREATSQAKGLRGTSASDKGYTSLGRVSVQGEAD